MAISLMATLFVSGCFHQLFGVQNQSNGAVVDRLHFHMGTEFTVLGRIPQFGAALQELFVKGVAQLRTGSCIEAGPAALAAVAVEGELADHQ